MFGFEDMWKFFFSFFLVLPIVTFIHEAGYLFFGKVTGGKVRIHIGRATACLNVISGSYTFGTAGVNMKI